MRKKDTHVSARLPNILKKALVKEAKKRKESISNVVQSALLKELKLKLVKEKIVPRGRK